MKPTSSAQLQNSLLSSFLLRTGLGIVFLYAAVSAFLQPESWIGFFPAWLRAIIPGETLLLLFGLYQLLLALWLFSGWRTFYAASLTSLTLLAIIIVNITTLDIVFRDIAILFCAAALAILSRNEKHGK
ncbi:hypothetical protein HZB03_00765 [Candidatus Woesearchaeota archaeon]|nr:hypothetical protein [Candidatus Woesearchaeota archaeon]